MKLTLAQNADQVLQNVSRFTFKTFKIFGENLAAITHNPKRIYWDKPTIVGAAILELAKFQMYRFHYNIMKPHFDCRLLYSDTDSLLCKIRSDDFYKELAAKPNILPEFDFQITLMSINFSTITTDSSFSNTKMNSPENSSTSLFR